MSLVALGACVRSGTVETDGGTVGFVSIFPVLFRIGSNHGVWMCSVSCSACCTKPLEPSVGIYSIVADVMHYFMLSDGFGFALACFGSMADCTVLLLQLRGMCMKCDVMHNL